MKIKPNFSCKALALRLSVVLITVPLAGCETTIRQIGGKDGASYSNDKEDFFIRRDDIRYGINYNDNEVLCLSL